MTFLLDRFGQSIIDSGIGQINVDEKRAPSDHKKARPLAEAGLFQVYPGLSDHPHALRGDLALDAVPIRAQQFAVGVCDQRVR